MEERTSQTEMSPILKEKNQDFHQLFNPCRWSLNSWLVCAWGVIVFLMSVVHLGAWLQWVYLPLTLAIAAAFLVRKSVVYYVVFTGWIWVLSSEIRRIADFQSHYHPISLIQATPYVVTSLVFFNLVFAYLRTQDKKLYLPFMLSVLGILYAFVVGVFKHHLLAGAFDLLNWGAPVLFAAYITTYSSQFTQMDKRVRSFFGWSLLVLSIYGIIQYFYLPVWDVYWVKHAGMASIGTPLPGHVRVFSLLNSPGPFAAFVMVALIVLMTGKKLSRWVPLTTGFMGFWLSLVRSAWGGWFLGLMYFVIRIGWKKKVTALAMVLSALLMSYGGLHVIGGLALQKASSLSTKQVQTNQVSLNNSGSTTKESSAQNHSGVDRKLLHRMETAGNLGSDVSFKARVDFYKSFWKTALSNPVGAGLGSTGVGTKLSHSGSLGKYGNFDSGLMDIPFVLGWPGTLLYITGGIMLLVRMFRSYQNSNDVRTIYQGVVLALLSQLIFGNSLVGVTGLTLWVFVGLAIAERVHTDKQEFKPESLKVEAK